ncbi:MAG: DUF4349 domain-containing protein [Pseudomonadota bacterium]
MRRCVFLFTLITLLAGCSDSQKGAGSGGMAVAEHRVAHQRAAWIAYEHEIELEVPSGQTRQLTRTVQQACAALPKRGCTLLEATVRAGADAGATIRMRVIPDGVNKVLKSLDGRATVVTQSSKGEDLAEPIEDSERKLAMLTGYREQLQTLARQRALDPEALIKLHRELAEVQSEIEKAATARAQLHRRVDTELLTVTLYEHAKTGGDSKVKRAVADFGEDLLQGLAMLITFVASTIPFALAGTICYFAWRRIRARRRGAAAVPDKR